MQAAIAMTLVSGGTCIFYLSLLLGSGSWSVWWGGSQLKFWDIYNGLISLAGPPPRLVSPVPRDCPDSCSSVFSDCIHIIFGVQCLMLYDTGGWTWKICHTRKVQWDLASPPLPCGYAIWLAATVAGVTEERWRRQSPKCLRLEQKPHLLTVHGPKVSTKPQCDHR